MNSVWIAKSVIDIGGQKRPEAVMAMVMMAALAIRKSG
jgi:hypothetical protein